MRDNLDIVKYLHENGYPLNKDAFIYAACKGNLDIVKYLHENGCPWDERALGCYDKPTSISFLVVRW